MLGSILAAGLVPVVYGATYSRIESWKGDGFLDGFTYDASTYDNTTSGDVFWATADNTSLIYTSGSGTTILKVDNTTFVPYNEKRYAPKLHSKTEYDVGTVWVIDAVHLPYGCSVWPAIWTQGPNWPDGGEIDIFEGVNNQATNQIALHASSSACNADPSATFTGTLNTTSCDQNQNDGTGCATTDKNTDSYGAPFAAAGGGAYIAEYASDGIRVWFLTRSAIPSSVTADAASIDTSTLGTPVAYYPSSTCDISKFFGLQTLTIDITLCGTWAGQASIISQTCPALEGDKTCYTTYVINDASSTYANAYFELNYINVFSSGTSSASTSSASGSSASKTNSATTTVTGGAGSSSTAKTSSSSSSSNSSGATAKFDARVWGVCIAGLVVGLSLVL